MIIALTLFSVSLRDRTPVLISTGKLKILRHDGNTLGMDGTQVSVLEKANKVGLGCLLLIKKEGNLQGNFSSLISTSNT